MTAPAPLEVIASHLALFEPTGSAAEPDDLTGLVRYEAASFNEQPQASDIDLFAGVSRRQAKFSLSGDRATLRGRVLVAVLVEQQGLLRGAVGAAAVIAAFLLGIAIFHNEAVGQIEAAVTLLLITPAVLGYLLIRPSEHVLVGGLLAGVRRLVVATGVWPVLAAAALVLAGGDEPTLLRIALWILAAAAWVTTALLIASLVLGAQSRAERPSHPDNRLS